MTKQQQFLFIVQTTILANCANISADEKSSKHYRDTMSASGVMGVAADAIYASERIPEDMNALDAANDFCTFMLRNLREIEERAGGKLVVPDWFARY